MSNNKKGILDEVARQWSAISAPAEAMELAAAGPSIRLAWNNYYGSWIDGGWNNNYGSWADGGWNDYYGSWQDAGWNNSYGSWIDGGWNNFYGSWSDGSSGGGGGCFLTTACVEHRGLSDDCYELQAMRAMRDTIVNWSEENRNLVKEYYEIAPRIVEGINAQADSDAIWDRLYTDFISRCVSLYEENNIEGALSVYKENVLNLKAAYCGG